MILGLLDKTQQKAFVALAYKVILADYHVPAAEEDQFDLLKASLGIPGDISAYKIVGEPDLAPFDTRMTKAVVLTSLLLLALSDDEFHIAESDVLRDLNAKFGFSPAEYEGFKGAAAGYLAAIRTMEKIGRPRA